MALGSLVHLSALQHLLTFGNPVPSAEDDKHAGDVFSSGAVCSHFGDGQRADPFSPQ